MVDLLYERFLLEMQISILTRHNCICHNKALWWAKNLMCAKFQESKKKSNLLQLRCLELIMRLLYFSPHCNYLKSFYVVTNKRGYCSLLLSLAVDFIGGFDAYSAYITPPKPCRMQHTMYVPLSSLLSFLECVEHNHVYKTNWMPSLPCSLLTVCYRYHSNNLLPYKWEALCSILFKLFFFPLLFHVYNVS